MPGIDCARPDLPGLLSPLRPPGSGGKGLGEVLRLAHDLGRAKLHDAHRVVGFPVVGDDHFADPESAAATHTPDDELPPCRVVATLALDVASPAEPLARLRILEDRILGVDRLLLVLVPGLRCGPMPLDGGPTIGICHGCLTSSSVCLPTSSGDVAQATKTSCAGSSAATASRQAARASSLR